jgi:16S rRNA (adenine(1408)-N(1))-methyltransferase
LTLPLFRHAPASHCPRASRAVLSHFDDTPKRENGRMKVESIRGKRTYQIDAAALAAMTAGARGILVDIGTGDGRYVRHAARHCPELFVIGIDACRENLRDASRTAPRNALFVIANALALPAELTGLATKVAINFPWGSLMAGLLNGAPALFEGVIALVQSGAIIEIRLNQGALAEAGCSLQEGVTRIRQALHAWDFAIERSVALGADGLRACPTTWARRLAYGRDPLGWHLAVKASPICVTGAKRVP